MQHGGRAGTVVLSPLAGHLAGPACGLCAQLGRSTVPGCACLLNPFARPARPQTYRNQCLAACTGVTFKPGKCRKGGRKLHSAVAAA